MSGEVANLAVELAAAAAKLDAMLHARTAASLADLVRIMNCYYSNLIEGHNTRPRDIERALAADFDPSAARRNLQVEAAAHIRVQGEIDRLHAAAALPEPASPDFIRWLHREFYRDAAHEMLRVAGGGREFTMIPGEFRARAEHDVAVGRHVPPSSAAVPAFMDYFAGRFRLAPLGQAERIAAVASAHHRFNYIHPFPDGNGRVGRLMSHAMAHWAGIGARGLWSVSRGLARGLSSRSEYKSMLDHADAPRRGDLDGRGNLSERALRDFVAWFLRVCRDQIGFMGEMIALGEMRQRLRRLADAQNLPDGAASLLEQIWLVGALPRGAAARASGFGERKARGLLSNMLAKRRILASDSPKGAVYLHFSIDNAEILFPRLFPEA